jgi:hypothetical protein
MNVFTSELSNPMIIIGSLRHPMQRPPEEAVIPADIDATREQHAGAFQRIAGGDGNFGCERTGKYEGCGHAAQALAAASSSCRTSAR